MRGTLIRGLAGALALGLFWLLLLAAAAGVGPGQPWSPVQPLQLEPGKVHTVFGSAEAAADGLRVDALGARALGLQTWRVSLQAEDYDLLHYRFEGLPRSLAIDLVFRRAAQPENVVTTTLPAPVLGNGTVDLQALPQWRGRITELGFSEYPDPQLVPATAPVEPFVLAGADLEQRSWLGALRLLASDWLGYRPWRQSSINALDEQGPGGHWPLVPVLALGALGSLVLLVWLLRVPPRPALMGVVLGIWLLLDAHWLLRLSQRHGQARAAYAGKSWPERRQFQSDHALVEAAARIKHALVGEPRDRHVLLWADDGFVRGRLGYHLRPLNVGNWTPARGGLRRLASGSLLVVADRGGRWRFDPASDILDLGADAVRARRLWHGGSISLYRVERPSP